MRPGAGLSRLRPQPEAFEFPPAKARRLPMACVGDPRNDARAEQAKGDGPGPVGAEYTSCFERALSLLIRLLAQRSGS
jgi:hypothetical protein